MPAAISATKPPREWPISTTPWLPARPGPSSPRAPWRWAASTASTSASRSRKLSAPGKGLLPAKESWMAAESLPGCSSSTTGQPCSARAAASQLSCSGSPPRPGISSSHGPTCGLALGHSSSGSGALRWATCSCNRLGSRAASAGSRGGRYWRSGSARLWRRWKPWRWACNCCRHWEAKANRSSRSRVSRSTGKARSSSIVETLIWLCSSRFRVVSTRRSVLQPSPQASSSANCLSI